MFQSPQRKATLVWLTLLFAFLPALAAAEPSSDLLVPYFEVDLGGGRTTVFDVGNAATEALAVEIEIFSNWGVSVLAVPVTLGGHEILSVDLGSWLRDGRLPGRELDGESLSHLAAALAGRPSPSTGLYYGAEVAPRLAVGYVTIRARAPRRSVLWGDFSTRDGGELAPGAELLVDIDRRQPRRDVCRRHLLRLDPGADFADDARIVIWNERRGRPSATPEPTRAHLVADVLARGSDGAALGSWVLGAAAAQEIALGELIADPLSGSLEVVTSSESLIAVRPGRRALSGVGPRSWCAAPAAADPGAEIRAKGLESGSEPPDVDCPFYFPAIDIETATNGHDADVGPGPEIAVGDPVTWTYEVTNGGTVPLQRITVSDDQGVAIDCPGTRLDPGETMVCSAQGVAVLGPYSNLGSAAGTADEVCPVTVADEDPSHYVGVKTIL